MTKLSNKDLFKLLSELPEDLLKETLLVSMEGLPKAATGNYNDFQKKYFNDFSGFLLDCIDWLDREPALYQLDIATDVLLHKRYTIRAPRGAGKTAIAALLILFYALTRDGLDWKVPTTASNWKQLKYYLWPEVHKWAYRLKWDVIGREPFTKHELLDHNLKLRTGRAFAMTSNNKVGDEGASTEGSHADYMLYVFDEAKEINDTRFDSVEGSFTGGKEGYLFVISTPGAQMGRFYDIHSRARGYEEWKVRHITKDECIKAGQMSEEWALAREKQWGVLYFKYLNQVLGQFAADSTRGIIPLAFVDRANNLYEDWQARINPKHPPNPSYIGCDVATKVDDTVLAFYILPQIEELYTTVETLRAYSSLPTEDKTKISDLLKRVKLGEYFTTEGFIQAIKDILKKHPNLAFTTDSIEVLLRPYKDLTAMTMLGISKIEVVKKLNPDLATMQIADTLKYYLDTYPSCIVSIDSIGVGGGVAHKLNQTGYGERVISFDARESTYFRSEDGKKLFNKRTAMWVLGSELIHPESEDKIFLPPDDKLIAELTAAQEVVAHSRPNTIQVELKDQVRKRLHRSTDTADAVLMALFGHILSGPSTSGDVLDLAKYIRENS